MGNPGKDVALHTVMTSQTLRLKKAVKTIPGLNYLASVLKYDGMGGWVFQRPILQWICDPTLRQQLPGLYRFFGVYCQWFFDLTGAGYLRGGHLLFPMVAKFSNQQYLKLQLPEFTVFLDAKDWRMFAVVHELMSHKADTKILSRYLSAGDTFLDVGANHGSFSIVASQLVATQGKVIAIEPQPKLAKAIELSLSENRFSPFQVHQIAVGDSEGEVELMIPKDTSGAAGLYQEHSGTQNYDKVTVPMKPFDALDWQSLPGRVVMKLDVEGCEYRFLNGARKMIAARKPILIMEINPDTLKAARTPAAEMKQLLRELGYVQYAEMRSLDQVLPIEQLDAGTWRNIVLFAN